MIFMKKILKIAQFEFLDKARTKAFIIFTLFFPVIGIGIGIMPNLLLNNITSELITKNTFSNTRLFKNDDSLLNRDSSSFQQSGNISGTHIITDLNIVTQKSDVSNFSNLKEFSSAYVSSMILLLLFFMLILFSGGMLIRSLVEEKSNRIIEILLSSCTVNELLSGKIIGLSMLGLFQLFVWIIVAVFLSQIGYVPTEFFSNIGIIIIYFILGYMFFTSIFVGVGSIVNTEQEAQQFTTYLSFIMVIPLLFTIKIIQYPDAQIVKLLSYIPFTTPPVMVLRLRTQNIPLDEILFTIMILAISIYFSIYISSKIFRIGILSYGKHPTLKELYNWLKEK